MPVLVPSPAPAPAGTFPQVPLDVRLDLQPGGTWTPITSYAYQRNSPAITITCGRPDGSQQATPSTAQIELNNRDGRFSPRNPAGPWYGLLGRNTPLRISLPAASTYLRFADDSVSSLSAPDTAGLSITGDLDVQLDMDLASWVPAALIAKYVTSSTGRSWAVTLEADGTAGFGWSPDGITWLQAYTSLPLPTGRTGLRVTLAVATGTVTFYTAPAISGSWSQYGAASVLGAAGIYNSASPVTIGWNSGLADRGYTGLLGRVYAANILSGIGGTLKASPDFTAATAGGATLTDAQGNVWALSGTAEFSARSYRFHGECSALPQSWDETGSDVWTPVTAAGLLRRLGQASAPVVSTMRRATLAQPGGLLPVAYWPAEDATGATQIGAAAGPFSMYVAGKASFASDSSFACSNPIPSFNGSAWTGRVAAYTATGTSVIRFLLDVPASSSAADQTVICRVLSSGPVAEFTLRYRSGGGLDLSGWDPDGNNLFDTGVWAFGLEGNPVWVSMELRPSGGGIQYSVTTLEPGAGTGLAVAGTIASSAAGPVSTVEMNPGGSLTDVAAGHITVQRSWTSLFALAGPLAAWAGETAGSRFARLCSENGLACRIYGPRDATVVMGQQIPDTLQALLQQCEDADQGMIYDARDGLALGYRTLNSLCAQNPAAALSYPAAHLSPPLAPTDDDQYTRNDILLSRQNGSTIQVTQDSGPMSVQPPQDGVGDYQFSQTVSLASDAQLGDVAGWYLHVGTVDEERYPSVVVNLARSAVAAISADVQETGLGDYVTVSGLPAWMPPDDVRAIVWGATETLGGFICQVAWQTQPESPYEVLVAG